MQPQFNYKQRVLDYLAQADSTQPLLIGRVAIDLKMRLTLTEDILEELIYDKRLRYLTPAEKKRFDVRHAFMLLPV